MFAKGISMSIRWIAAGWAGLLCQVASADVATIDWSHLLRTTANDRANDVARDSAGNIVIAGTTGGALFPGTGTAYIAKYTPAGSLIWGKQYSGAAVNIAVDPFDNIFTMGTISSDIAVQKFDSSGNPLWTRQFGSAQVDQGNGIGTDAAGNVYVTGRVSAGLSNDGAVAKYSPTGTQLWVRTIGTSNAGDVAMGVKVDPSGNVVVVGSSASALEPGRGGSSDPYVRKYDTNGAELWTRQWGSNQPDTGLSVAIDSAGSILVLGDTNGNIDGASPNTFGSEHAYVTKLAIDGSTQWIKQLKLSDEEYAQSIAVDAAGNPALALTGFSSQTNFDFLLASVSGSNGSLRWSQKYATGADEEMRGVAVDASGTHVWMTGYTGGFFNGQGDGASQENGVIAALSVPEPAAGMLLMVPLLMRFGWRRRRAFTG